MTPFQCHHGVPASQQVLAVEELDIAVSMPPRRSCFVGIPLAGAGPDRVSMPPRRSCFSERMEWEGAVFVRFQCHHGVPASPKESRSLFRR